MIVKKDKRLCSKAWRDRVGFDNIDPAPRSRIEKPRKKYVPPAERRISDDIDDELFRRI